MPPPKRVGALFSIPLTMDGWMDGWTDGKRVKEKKLA